MGFKKNNPGCLCCGPPLPCDECDFDNDTEFEVFVNGQGPFILTWRVAFGFDCFWAFNVVTEDTEEVLPCGQVAAVGIAVESGTGRWVFLLSMTDGIGRVDYFEVVNFIGYPSITSCSFFDGSSHVTDVEFVPGSQSNIPCTGIADSDSVTWTIEVV